MWGYSIHVVIVPSFLAFTFLGPLIYLHSLTDFNVSFSAIWILGGAILGIFVQGQVYTKHDWIDVLALIGITLSMTVNALVTGLIVFRIFKLFQEVKASTADDQFLGVTGRSTLRRVIFILIESGMALFSVQSARLVVRIAFMLDRSDSLFSAFHLIAGIYEMLEVIIRSVIVTSSY